MSVLEGPDMPCEEEQDHGVSKFCVPLLCGSRPAAAGTEEGLAGEGGSAKSWVFFFFGGGRKDAPH